MGAYLISSLHPKRLLIAICVCCIMSMIGITLWPVFLVQLRDVWELSNSQIGWISGAYFVGYVVATPLLVGLTDFLDSRLIFLSGCVSSFLGCLGFAFLANDFLSALVTYTLMGAGLAGTYMPGLQILNARLSDDFRVKAVPWYTSSFGLGSGISFLVMGYLLAYSNYTVAALLGAIGALASGVYVYFFVSPIRPTLSLNKGVDRHPLDLRPAFRKPKAMGYIFAYSAHTYELFAFRSWSFALFVFLGDRAESTLNFSQIATIFAFLTILGMVASTTGAKLCLMFGRHRSISWIGSLTALLAVACSLLISAPLWLSLGILCVYNVAIMFDSGSLTAGTVSVSDPEDRGALLAVHSMIGFAGGAIGAPVIGYTLDIAGGEENLLAWSLALLLMGIGSFLVSIIQSRFWRYNR